jgi:hypothetical protein
MLALNFLISLYQVNKINQQSDVRVCPAAYFNTETTRFYGEYYWEFTPKFTRRIYFHLNWSNINTQFTLQLNPPNVRKNLMHR